MSRPFSFKSVPANTTSSTNTTPSKSASTTRTNNSNGTSGSNASKPSNFKSVKPTTTTKTTNNTSTANDTSSSSGVQFSGHLDLTEQEFEKYYLTHLETCISNNEYIYVGGSKGADELTQKYARQLIMSSSSSSSSSSSQNNKNKMNCFKLVVVCELKNDDYRVDKRFEARNGFSNHTARDEFLTQNTCRDVAFIRYKPMSLGSGTLANILRRQFGSSISKKFKKHARDLFAKAQDQESKELFDEIIDSFVLGMSSAKSASLNDNALDKLPKVIRDCTMGYPPSVQ